MDAKWIGRVVVWGLALSPALAIACSESMFREQMGLRHFGAARQQPARILVVEGEAGAAFADSERVYGSLRKAGHEVVPVAGIGEAQAALGGERYDLVLAAPEQAERVLAGIDAAHAGTGAVLPQVVPLLGGGGRDCSLCIHADDSAREVLRIVGRALHAAR